MIGVITYFLWKQARNHLVYTKPPLSCLRNIKSYPSGYIGYFSDPGGHLWAKI